MRTLIRRRGLEGITLVGHSLGGAVALLTVLGLRDEGEVGRIRRLVLVAGAAYRQRLPPFVRLARYPRATRALFRALGPRVVVGQAIRFIVYDRGGVTGGQIEGYAAPLGQEGALHALLRTADLILPPGAGPDSGPLRPPPCRGAPGGVVPTPGRVPRSDGMILGRDPCR